MAETNILIGVGGTGAKVVESALVLMAAGLGPKRVMVGLVDQDNANGNVARTRRLLNGLVDLRERWSRDDVNRIDWAGLESAAPGSAGVNGAEPISAGMGSVRVDSLFEDGNALWCPSRTKTTLRGLVGEDLDEGRRQLFDMMFMEGRDEQDLPLAKGYRGRAHVGATALVAALVDDESVLLQRLRELMEHPGHERVNVFIIGSAFGGTGAAGFPTLSRALDAMRRDPGFNNGGNVSLGGLLMLPYFTFRNPPEGGEPVVTPDELLPKARLALEYYDNLFEHETTFDQFYALGWPQFTDLGYHQDGAAEQENPALPAELVAATAALAFFQGEPPIGTDKVQVMVSARQDATVRWRSLPLPEIEARLGQLLRFAVYWRYIAEPALAHKGWFSNWAQKLAQGAKVVEAETTMNALRRVIDHILSWAATIEFMGGAQWQGGPWHMADLCDPEHEPRPTQPVAIRQTFSETALLDAFDQLIRTSAGEVRPRAGASVYADLSRASGSPRGNHRGIGRTVAAVYAASGF